VPPVCLRGAVQGDPSEGATLEIDFLPIVISCLNCGKDTEVEYVEAACPECGSGDVLLAGGTEELRLLELDVIDTSFYDKKIVQKTQREVREIFRKRVELCMDFEVLLIYQLIRFHLLRVICFLQVNIKMSWRFMYVHRLSR
jgi:hypothetical protein